MFRLCVFNPRPTAWHWSLIFHAWCVCKAGFQASGIKLDKNIHIFNGLKPRRFSNYWNSNAKHGNSWKVALGFGGPSSSEADLQNISLIYWTLLQRHFVAGETKWDPSENCPLQNSVGSWPHLVRYFSDNRQPSLLSPCKYNPSTAEACLLFQNGQTPLVGKPVG